MDIWIIPIVILVASSNLITAYTLRDSSLHQPARACGHKLAEVLSLVCKHGYYQYFSTPDDGSNGYRSDKRYKRGIVDECCHSGCSYHTLEQYCIPPTTEAPDNSQIRKRSDNDEWRDISNNDAVANSQNLYPSFHHHRYGNYIDHQDKDKRLVSNDELNSEHGGQQKDLFQNMILPSSGIRNSKELFGNIQKEVYNIEDVNGMKSKEGMMETVGGKLMIQKVRNSIENGQKSSIESGEHRSTRGQRRWQINSMRSDKLRHSGERHRHHNFSARDNEEDVRVDEEQKQENRSVISRVGIENPYFLAKESVHPKVKPTINFTVKQQML